MIVEKKLYIIRLYFVKEYSRSSFNDIEIPIKLKNTPDDLAFKDIINTLTDYMLNHEKVALKIYI